MAIQLLKKNTGTDADMENFKKNLRGHRFRVFAFWVGVLALILVAAATFWVNYKNKVYSDYEVVNSYERSDTVTTQYTEFLDYVLKYSQDGISCVDSRNQLVWSQTYSMQSPMVAVCGNSAAIAEENGTEAMIFGESGLLGSVQTSYPIRQIEVSSQGVLAALLEDGDITRLYLYDSAGTVLVEAKFELQDTGYPLRMSLSVDATKLAVTFLQIQDGSVNTCIAFYNFDSVGENSSDHLVASRIIKGEILPSVHYLDSTHCYVVGTDRLLFYEGSQIPEEAAEISLEKEILSVFTSDDYLGFVTEGEEESYALQVYNSHGNLEFELEFDLDYKTIKFSGESVLIYNDYDCMIVNHAGKVIFETSFEEAISNLYTMSGSTRYIVMHASRTDQIRLR
ncbi:MAG: DUF5711 family protein [Lachnospiraceae bacterium]|nr:DUF5711 family protein [Lachnospiraceae bacterium]